MPGEIAMPKENKYAEWNVRDAVSTLKRAEEILNDSEMVKLARIEMAKEIVAVNEAVRRLNLETKVREKLKKV